MKVDIAAFELVSIDGEMALVLRLGRRATDPVPSLEKVKRAYRSAPPERDTVGPFLADRTARAIGSRIRATPLYLAYSAYCEAQGEKRLTRRDFRGAMMARGFASLHSNGSWWRDIALVDDHAGLLL